MSGVHVLIVEDEAMVSMILEDIIEDAGCAVAGTATTVAMALDMVGDGRRIDCALLVARVCEAWAVMVHVDGLFHCDPRPSNLLLQEVPGLGPLPVLVDFGLCKQLERGERLALSRAVHALIETDCDMLH